MVDETSMIEGSPTPFTLVRGLQSLESVETRVLQYVYVSFVYCILRDFGVLLIPYVDIYYRLSRPHLSAAPALFQPYLFLSLGEPGKSFLRRKVDLLSTNDKIKIHHFQP